MLTLEAIGSAIHRELSRLPRLVRVGLLVFALGLLVDVALHVLAGALAGGHPHPDHEGPELAAHCVVFVGMVLIQIGVVRDGVRQSRARPATSGRDTRGVA